MIDRLLAANPKRIIVFDTPPDARRVARLGAGACWSVRSCSWCVPIERPKADVREAVALLDGCDHISPRPQFRFLRAGARGRFGSYYGQEK